MIIIPMKKCFVPRERGLFIFWVNGFINNKKAVFVVDTGASRTAVDLNRIKSFSKSKLKKYKSLVARGLGKSKKYYGTRLNIGLGPIKFIQHTCAVLSLDAINELLKEKGKSIDGVIGTDILDKCHSIINLRKQKIYLNFK